MYIKMYIWVYYFLLPQYFAFLELQKSCSWNAYKIIGSFNKCVGSG